MRILHVTPAYPPHVGGVERYVYNLVSTQRLLGNDTYVMTSNLSNSSFSEANVTSLPVLYNFKGNWGEMPICPTILGALRKADCDVFHGHVASKFFCESIAFYRLFAKKKKPLVLTYHLHNESLTPFKRSLWHIHNRTVMHAFLRSAEVIIVATKEYKTLLNNVFRIHSRKMEVIPPGVDDEIFNPNKYSPDQAREEYGIFQENVIVFIGRLVSTKGVDYLIRTLPIVRERIHDASLVIVGNGAFKTELQALSRELRIEPHVKFIGEIPQEDIPQIMSLANVIVLPSLTEVFPLVLLEGMSMEKPVIATRVGGIPDVMVDGQTGLLVEKGSVNDLADAIVLILSDRKLASGMGKRGRKLVQKQYNWIAITRRVLKTYDNALGNLQLNA